MNEPTPDSERGTPQAAQDVLRPLSETEVRQAPQLSQEDIRAAIERGREALESLETASRHSSVISPKLRFS